MADKNESSAVKRFQKRRKKKKKNDKKQTNHENQMEKVGPEITPQHWDLQVLTALPELDAGRQRQLGTGRVLRSERRMLTSLNIRS